MDPLTAFLIATMMMLLNGGVLGLVHSGLPADLRPSAFSWRVGTLLMAAGCVLLVVQAQLPALFVLPLANGLLLLGISGYWRAMRQFYGIPDRWLLLLPTVLGVISIAWFTAVVPSLVARVVAMSVIWAGLMFACIHSMRMHTPREDSVSRRVLIAILLLVVVFMLLRAVYFLFNMSADGTVIDSHHWINLITPMVAAVLPVIGTTAFLLMCSERIRRQWEMAASTDYLTGLPNRRTLAASGERLLQMSRSEGARLAVCVIDIDHFKSINDRFGHDVGDQALRFVASRISAACSDGDMPARQGGEEFAVLLERADGEQALAAAERIRGSIAGAPFFVSGNPLTITASLGVAVFGRNDHLLDDGLRRADEALYLSKSNGRNRSTLAA
ncbi:MAG: diguanylate cyclase [Pseudomarimonas sp.]